MSKLTESAIHLAMFSCLEGYVTDVVDSIQFESGRELSEEEHQQVYAFVEKAITEATNE
ncbi:TPA: hypothetical protein QCI16_004492 [Enterobacter ludwigii]|nr:hypothetical protein [Enterobacter ludwigii]HDR2600270.1 hypothetical protein [Enterobacter ludwigii]